MKLLRLLPFLFVIVPVRLQAAAPDGEASIVVIGATPGGIAAAVAAAREGRDVIIADHQDHIGGIVANGLTNADIQKRQAVGGLFYEFTREVVKHYRAFDRDRSGSPNLKLSSDGYNYEAHVAERIFHDLVSNTKGRITLLLRHELKEAVVEGNRLTAVVLANRAKPGERIRIRGRVFVDATYEGDLAALAGAPFRVGREARSEFNEPHAGRIYVRWKSTTPLPGSTGEGDNATQAFCFRFHVTNDPANRVPIAKPEGWNRDDYRFALEDIRAGRVTRFGHIIQLIRMPNGKWELNSDHADETGTPAESLDLAEENWDWPTATLERREQIHRRYLTHNVGLIWLLQNDPEVPETLRRDALQWGWCRDEWPENGHVPRQVYVRQGRRIVGDYLLTQHDGDLDSAMERTRLQPTSISVIEFPFDPHGHHKYDPKHLGVREGYFIVFHAPFQVPYGVIVPKKIDGLLVPVACSASHVAYNALRMEPVFMALGEAAGLAAHLAIAGDVSVRRVPAGELQRLLVERRGVITYYDDLPFDHPAFAAFQWLGARGLNKAYLAEPERRLSRRDGWEKLTRILQAEGRRCPTPAGELGAKLTGTEVVQWLIEAGGHKVDAPTLPPDQALTLQQFASLVYQSLAGRR